jgi:hypothetical protein
LRHSEFNEEFKVVCVCAEEITKDYFNPKKLEKGLRQKASIIE